MRYIKPAAALYSLLSVFIGPMLVIFALGRGGRVGMDCSDSTWHTISQVVKDAYYADAALIMTAGSVVMLILGVVLLFLLLQYQRGIGKIVLSCSIVFMMAGYALILFSADTWNCQ